MKLGNGSRIKISLISLSELYFCGLGQESEAIKAGETTEAACDSAAVDGNICDQGPGYQLHGTACRHPGTNRTLQHASSLGEHSSQHRDSLSFSSRN